MTHVKRSLSSALMLFGCLLFAAASQAELSSSKTPKQESKSVTVQLSAAQPNIKTGSEFFLDLLAVDAPKVYGLQLVVKYDPKVLQLVDANENKNGVQIEHGNFFNRQQFFTLINKNDPLSGTIKYTVSQVNPAKSVVGNGRLARLFFKSKGIEGNTEVIVTQAKFGTRDGKIIDSQTQSKVELQFAQSHAVQTPAPNPPMSLSTLLKLEIAAVLVFFLIVALLYRKKTHQQMQHLQKEFRNKSNQQKTFREKLWGKTPKQPKGPFTHLDHATDAGLFK